jgi:L-2-hydroxyglutarate oxidase LhgO
MALAREGYRWSDVSGHDLLETLTYHGFWRLARRHAAMGLYEVRRSFSRKLLTRDLQRLVPAIQETDLLRGPSGVRAQALDAQGNLLDDFAFAETAGALFVLNAPSPAATASLAIGEHLADCAARLMEVPRPAARNSAQVPPG